MSDYDIAGNMIIKSNVNNNKFNELMKQYFDKIDDAMNDRKSCNRGTDPVNYFCDYLSEYYILSYIDKHIEKQYRLPNPVALKNKYPYETTVQLVFNEDWNFIIKEEVNGQVIQSSIYKFMIRYNIYKSMISDYGIDVPQSIKLKMERGEGYNTDYNNPEDLKKLGLDKQDDAISCKLEHSSLEQTENSQRER